MTSCVTDWHSHSPVESHVITARVSLPALLTASSPSQEDGVCVSCKMVSLHISEGEGANGLPRAVVDACTLCNLIRNSLINSYGL